MEKIILRLDSKGKLNLGELAKSVSSYRVKKEENGKVTLTQFVEIPLSEKRIFDNQGVLEKVKSSLCKLEN